MYALESSPNVRFHNARYCGHCEVEPKKGRDAALASYPLTPFPLNGTRERTVRNPSQRILICETLH